MAIIDRRGLVVDGTPSSALSAEPDVRMAIKVPCRVATTANITLSGLQTIDAIALAAGDRVLVKNQSSGTENGIYEASSGNWTRATDFDGAFDVVKGTLVLVNEGTVGGGFLFEVTTSDPIVAGTSSIAFALSTAYQPNDAELTAIAGLTSAANKVPYFTGAGAAALADFTAAARALLDDTTAAAMVTTLGAAAIALNLSDLANKAAAKDNISIHGADIASATTTNLETATGDCVDVTGTTTITAITLSEGHERTVRFTGILTLTHGASLVIPGAVNFITAAGDFVRFRGYAAGVVRVVSIQLANANEEVSSTVTFASPFAISTGGSGVVWNTVSIPRAGLWAVGGNCGINKTGGTTPTYTHLHNDHNITSATTIQTSPGGGSTQAQHITSNNENGWINANPVVWYRTTGAITVNFVGTADFTGGTCGIYGRGFARRVGN